jgi:DNA-binding MarR family transcriptional regulator
MGSQASSAAAVLVALRRIVRFLRLVDRKAEAAVGLSAAQLFVLQALHDEPASSLADLAERTLTDQSSVSTVVAKLVEQRLVTRKISLEDRRRAELTLTAAGERVVRKAPRVPQTRLAEAVRTMDPAKREQLVESIEALVIALGADEVSPAMFFEDEKSQRSRSRVRR